MQSLSHHQTCCHVKLAMISVEKRPGCNALESLTGSHGRQALRVKSGTRGGGSRASGVAPTARENYDHAGFGQYDDHLRLHGATIAEQIDGA
jgi:hypothetical protein